MPAGEGADGAEHIERAADVGAASAGSKTKGQKAAT